MPATIACKIAKIFLWIHPACFRYEWLKHAASFPIDNVTVTWISPVQSGSIEFQNATAEATGLYRCRATNNFGSTLSKIYAVKQRGTLLVKQFVWDNRKKLSNKSSKYVVAQSYPKNTICCTRYVHILICCLPDSNNNINITNFLQNILILLVLRFGWFHVYFGQCWKSRF